MERTERDTILDSINEGVFTIDLDWRITSFNRAAERITGIAREEAVGRACSDVFHADICEKKCPLRSTFRTGEPTPNASGHIIDCRGRKVPLRISTAVLKNRAGKIIGGVETFQDLSQVEQLRKELEGRCTFEDIIGRSPDMLRLFDILPRVAESESTVLIEGGSGTGKELFARAIHNLSGRAGKRFVPVNCAAFPDTLLESELFGHKAGAFTDARKDKPGRLVTAEGGTVFLDEIGDMSPALQARLLRVLQDRMVEPLGGVEPVPIDVRVIAATNRSLSDLVREGEFREDLYYRVRVIHMEIPELKRRRGDIPLLIDHFVARFNRVQGKDIAGVSMEAMMRLMEHDFPGNVRELENIIEQAFVLCRGGMIEISHLPVELRESESRSPDIDAMSLRIMEEQMIAETLRRCEGSRVRAARDLGIDVSTLYRKIRKMGIAVPEKDGRGRRRQGGARSV